MLLVFTDCHSAVTRQLVSAPRYDAGGVCSLIWHIQFPCSEVLTRRAVPRRPSDFNMRPSASNVHDRKGEIMCTARPEIALSKEHGRTFLHSAFNAVYGRRRTMMMVYDAEARLSLHYWRSRTDTLHSSFSAHCSVSSNRWWIFASEYIR